MTESSSRVIWFRKWGALVVFSAIVAVVAILGSAVTLPKIPTWYAGLEKPAFNPPNWVFGPVWTLLYALMALAGWRVWLGPAPGRTKALQWFFVQLALNAAWSPIFFGWQRPALALVIIVLLLLAIVFTIMRFWSLDRVAAWALTPYLGWVAFATLLNASIVVLN